MVYGGDPLNDELDEVRFLIGDTDTTTSELTDLEVDYLLQKHSTPLAAAIQACYNLAAKYSKLVDTQADDVRVRSQQKSQNYIDLAKSLARRMGHRGAIPVLTGDSKAERTTYRSNTDKIDSNFTTDMMDFGNSVSKEEEL